MKLNQTTLAAAALAGLFAVGTAANAAQTQLGAEVSVFGQKEKCSGKDGCDGKKKKDGDKEKCSGKDGCSGKEKKKGTIL